MKKIILFVLLLMVVVQPVFSKDVNYTKAIQASNDEYTKNCEKLAKGFNKDNRFANYLRGSCSDYQFKMQKTISTLYPQRISSNPTQKHSQSYYANKAEFIKNLNNKNFEIQKLIAKEYCKQHKSKFPEACASLK